MKESALSNRLSNSMDMTPCLKPSRKVKAVNQLRDNAIAVLKSRILDPKHPVAMSRREFDRLQWGI